MTKYDVLQQVEDRYKSEGYRVTRAAGKGVLPAPIAHLRDDVDLIAQKDDKFIAIEIKRRDQLYDLAPPLEEAVKRHLPGWSYDLIVYPPDGVDGIPLEDGEPSPEYVESLLAESGQLLRLEKPRAAFLVGWAAIESSMRTAARREPLDIGDGSPGFVLKSLFSNGLISREDFDRLRRSLDDRNRLVHGLATDRLGPEDVRFLIEFAGQLLYGEPAPSDARS
jgi:hypothetical protein